MSARRMGMFPLSTVLFPHAELPLHVFEVRYRTLVADCMASDGSFGVVMIERGSEVGGGDQRSRIGTAARIAAARLQSDGRWLLVAMGVERIRVSEWLAEEPYPLATVETMPEVPVDHESGLLVEATARVRRTRALLSELGEQRPLPLVADLGDDPSELMWRLCAAAPVSLFDRQRLLVAEDPEARLSLLIEFCDEAAEDMTRMLAAGTPPDPSS